MSELKVNTISEVTGANGVVVDSVKLKDGGIVISDAGNIGSASDTDAIAIASGGGVTFSQAATFSSTIGSGAITSSAIIKTDDATEATSTTDGSLQTDGGLSVVKDIVAGDDIKLLSDAAVVHFGADSEITLTHSADSGLLLKHTATADDKPIVLTLQTGETDMAADDVIGAINFQAPDEGTGTDAILVAAGIEAVAEGDFSSSNNATKLSFKTGASEAAAEKMSLSSAGLLRLGGSTGAQAAADNLVIQGAADTGISIFSGGDDKAAIYLGTDGANNDCKFEYDNDTNALVVHTAAAEVMKIDGNGHITTPKQPCFFVYKSGNQAGGSGTADITFDTERFDLNADFGSNVFTAPVTGKYSFQAVVGHVNAQAGGNVSVYLQPSNAEIRAYRNDSDSGTSNYQSASISTVIDMDANDTCKLQFNSSSDNDFIIESATYRTYFSGYLVA